MNTMLPEAEWLQAEPEPTTVQGVCVECASELARVVTIVAVAGVLFGLGLAAVVWKG